MTRPSPLLWFSIIALILLPSTAGKFLLDLAGGLIIILIALPLLLAGAGWVGWRILKSKMVQCEKCGTSVLGSTTNCPACGSIINRSNQNNSDSTPASAVTIDITAKDVK